MNKRGFTLVELLAVIAILAILVVMLVPNFIGLFKQSKENTLIIETQSLMKQAQQQWILGGAKAMTFTNNSTISNSKKLDVENGDKFHYCIKMDSAGNFTYVAIDNEEYSAFWTSTTGITMSKLESSKVRYSNGTNTTRYTDASNAARNCTANTALSDVMN